MLDNSNKLSYPLCVLRSPDKFQGVLFTIAADLKALDGIPGDLEH